MQCHLPRHRPSLRRECWNTGRGHDRGVGSFGLEKPESRQAADEKGYGTKPAFALVDQHAVNCIIDTVRANPGQVTIAAIGPCAALHPSADCIQQLLSAGADVHAVDACGRTALMRAWIGRTAMWTLCCSSA